MNHSCKNIKLKKLAIAMLTVIVLTVTASPFYVSEVYAGTQHKYELSFNGIVNKAGTYVNMLGKEMDFKIYCDGEHVTDTSGYTITIGSKTGREIKCKVGNARLDSFGSLWLTTDPDAFFETSVKMYLNTPEGEKVEFGWRKRYGPGYESDITLTRGEDVVPINGGFGGNSTAEMTVRYKGQAVDSFEFMPSGKSLGDISSEGSLLICEPKAEGDQNITIKVGSEQAVFRWHVAGEIRTEDKAVEETESKLCIGFDRYIVEPDSNFGADVDIRITVLYDGKATSDFTYRTGNNKIGNISVNPSDKSQLLLSPEKNGDEEIIITCKGETQVFIWHTEHVERVKNEESNNTADKPTDSKPVTKTKNAAEGTASPNSSSDGKNEKVEAGSPSLNEEKLSTEKETETGIAADASPDENIGGNNAESENVSDPAGNDDAGSDAKSETEISDDETSYNADNIQDGGDENSLNSDEAKEHASAGNAGAAEDESADSENTPGIIAGAIDVFSAFIRWLKNLIAELLF